MSTKTTRRVLAAGVATLGLTLLPAAGALAHDCIQVSRSERGSTAAGNSQAWVSFSVAGIVASEGHDAETTACILDGWAAAGGPAVISIHVKGANGSGGVVAGKNPNSQILADGRGIDLLSSWMPTIDAIYEECGA